jgi:hypothetical protein
MPPVVSSAGPGELLHAQALLTAGGLRPPLLGPDDGCGIPAKDAPAEKSDKIDITGVELQN